MKKLIILMCIIFTFNSFSERYEGGYVDGEWFPLYRNNLRERICLEPNGGGDERMGCFGGMSGYVSFKGNIEIIGIAEVDGQILFKLSDFNITDYNGYSYTPSDYPVKRKKEGEKFFPVFTVLKQDLTKILKKKNLNLKYNGTAWEEEYVDNGSYEMILISELSKIDASGRKYDSKKIKFLGVEKIKLDFEVAESSYYSLINAFWIYMYD